MEDDDYNKLMIQKEKELLELKQLRSVQFQEQCIAKDKVIAQLQAKQAQIEDDFNYNVKLIEDRDKELEDMETKLIHLKRQLAQREEEVAGLKADLFAIKGEGNSAKKVSKALERDFKQTRDDLTEQVRSLRWAKEQTTRDYESQIASIREQYDAELQAKEVALQTLRSEINANFDKQAKARESSFIQQQGVLENELQELRISNAKLQQEVSQLKSSGNDSAEQARACQNKIVELELTHKSELRSVENKTEEAKFQVQRLESENAFLLKQNDSMKLENSNHIKLLTQEKTQLETEIRDLRDKHSQEMKRIVEMKDSTFERLQEANINQMKRLQDRTGDLVSENESLLQDLQRMKEQVIHSTRQVDFDKAEMIKEYESNKEEWVRLLQQASSDLKLKDTEIASYKEQLSNLDTKSGQKSDELCSLKSENMQLQENTHKLKNEIASLTHKHNLEIDDLKMQIKTLNQDAAAQKERFNMQMQAEQENRNIAKFDPRKSASYNVSATSSPLRRLWSEDLGPVTLDDSFKKEASGRYVALEAENVDLKQRIAEMRFEMEQVMNQVKTTLSPKKMSSPSITAEDRLKSEVMRLTKERDQLLDISSNLKAQLNSVDFDKPEEPLPLVMDEEEPQPQQASPTKLSAARAASPLTTQAATLYRKRLRNRSSERKKPLPKYANFENIGNEIKVEADQVVRGNKPLVRNYNIKD